MNKKLKSYPGVYEQKGQKPKSAIIAKIKKWIKKK